MMVAGIERLSEDPDTAVIVLLSKPPSPGVARRVLERARAAAKPVVVCFLGGDPAPIRAGGAHPAATLDEAATLAVALARGRSPAAGDGPDGEGSVREAARAQAGRLAPGQWAVRGLFSGGTLCSEAALILADLLADQPGRGGHTLLDLGDDEFTVGRPHPMIDFRLRNERIVAAAEDPATAVILLDIVLGYGSHPDPAGALAPAIDEARARAARAERPLIVIGSVCGTPADPQNLLQQEERLGAAGVLLAPSNAQAARLAALVAREAAVRQPGGGPAASGARGG